MFEIFWKLTIITFLLSLILGFVALAYEKGSRKENRYNKRTHELMESSCGFTFIASCFSLLATIWFI